MGDYITSTRHFGKERLQKRPLVVSPEGTFTFNPFFKPEGGTGVGWMNAPRQITTSYRTGRLAEVPFPEGLTAKQQKDYLLVQGTQDAPGREYSSQWDTGHEFQTEKTDVTLSHENVKFKGLSAGRFPQSMTYEGFLVPNPLHHGTYETQSWAPYPEITPVNLGYYGSTAIKNTIPTNPTASLSVFLGELLQMLPKAVGQAVLSDKGSPLEKVANEHLNLEFGLRPTGSELGMLAAAIVDASNRIKQVQRDSGRIIHRKMSFPEEFQGDFLSSKIVTEPFIVASNNNSAQWYPFFWNGAVPVGKFTESVTTRRRIWFSGAYSYYLQEGNELLDKVHAYADKANHVLGSRITPSTLWELAPWSWFGDWLGSIGANFHNASALTNDGLVLRYGYLMCETTRTRSIRVENCRLRDGSYLPTVAASWTTVQKKRVQASPYGFGLNPSSFTGRQWAILAALGVTQGGGKLGRVG